jgi:putative GTP pyrophosphokinase
MNQLEFKELFRQEMPQYEAWGKYIESFLIGKIKHLLKVPVKSRVKDESSLITKAFYKPEKGYTDPYTQITDKVGLRVVVLLNSDVSTICNLIENNTEWRFSKDRDYARERFVRTEFFGYESVHYILYNELARDLDGLQVRAGICAELQIRTLLQHAHSELTHDRIYKPKVEASQEVIRTAARSAALVEVAGELFSYVDRAMTEALEKTEVLEKALAELFHSNLPLSKQKYEEKINDYVFSHLFPLAQKNRIDIQTIKTIVTQDPNLLTQLSNRFERQLLAAQPVSFLIYSLVKEAPFALQEAWGNILPASELEPYFRDLGRPLTTDYD